MGMFNYRQKAQAWFIVFLLVIAYIAPASSALGFLLTAMVFGMLLISGKK